MSQVVNSNFDPRSQMEFSNMYDQYLQKSSESSFDLSLTVPESRSLHTNYMGDQANFGVYESGVGRVSTGADPYTDMSQMSAPLLGVHHEPPHTAPHPVPQQHTHPQAMYQMGVGIHGAHNPQFPPQHLYIPPISQHNQIMTAQTTGYAPPGVGHVNPIYTSAGLVVNGPPPPHPMMTAPGGMMHGTYYPRPPGVRSGGSPPNSGGSPSPGSEDSDDSAQVAQGGKVKRPSPEVPVEAPQPPAKGKKPRVSKKSKKKKDPNEPSKPVSAYALFFRDTQAAIKGSNPNASFGEVSKIVASMWDSLDAENKGVYKKKTEAAKKEYLKALAAYRATLVSQGTEGDQMFSGHTPGYPPFAGANPPYGYPATTNAGTHPQGHSPPQLSPLAKKSPMMNPLMGPEGAQPQALMNPPMSQPMPPSAPPMMPHGHIPNMGIQGQNAQSPMAPHQNAPTGAPAPTHLNPMNPVHPPTSPYITPQQSNPSLSSPVSSLGTDVGSPGGGRGPPQPQQQQQSQPPQQQSSPPHQGHQPIHPHQAHPQQTMQQQLPQPGCNHTMGAGPPQHPPASNGLHPSHGHCRMGGSCIRSGCSNPAVHNPEWEDEYCSNECVVSHCRDVFNCWVQSGQGSNPTYPAPVK